MFISKKKLSQEIDELEEQLFLNYKKLNLTIIDASRQHHVFGAIRGRLGLNHGE